MRYGKIKIKRMQTVEVNLLREPKGMECTILNEHNELLPTSMFDVDDLFDWNNEVVIDEDYSYGAEFIKDNE